MGDNVSVQGNKAVLTIKVRGEARDEDAGLLHGRTLGADSGSTTYFHLVPNLSSHVLDVVAKPSPPCSVGLFPLEPFII